MSKRLNETINDKYIKLWEDNASKVSKIPSLYPELKKNKLLFVGINPSCPDSKLKKRLKRIGSNLTPEEFKEWDPSKIEEKREVIKNERDVAKGRYDNKDEPYRYFKPFKEISEEVGLGWEHIDLFRTIAKTQKKLKNLIDISSNGKPNGEFEKRQIQIFKRLLKKLEPKIIVVQNALARDIIMEEYEIDDKNWNKEEGFHIIELKKKEIPIFFSGMLSGQRALDLGSKKRLVWHIKKAKDWIEENS